MCMIWVLVCIMYYYMFHDLHVGGSFIANCYGYSLKLACFTLLYHQPITDCLRFMFVWPVYAYLMARQPSMPFGNNYH